MYTGKEVIQIIQTVFPLFSSEDLSKVKEKILEEPMFYTVEDVGERDPLNADDVYVWTKIKSVFIYSHHGGGLDFEFENMENRARYLI